MAKKYPAAKAAPTFVKYILRNITKNDINLGDLRYKIPAGRARNLLSKTANIPMKLLIASIKKGSIAARLGKGLVEVETTNQPRGPLRSIAQPSAVHFPQRSKSSIVIEIGDIADEIAELTLEEDEEYLKKLQMEDSLDDLPVVAKEKDDEEA